MASVSVGLGSSSLQVSRILSDAEMLERDPASLTGQISPKERDDPAPLLLLTTASL